MSNTRPQLISAAELRRTTAPALLVARARREPARVAFRAKKLGLYRERTWGQYAAMVARTVASTSGWFSSWFARPAEKSSSSWRTV